MRECQPTFEIVLNYPQRRIGRRVWRALVTVTAGLLVLVGLVAAVVAIPATFAVVGFVIGWVTTDPGDPDQFPTDDVPVGPIALVWLVSGAIAIFAGRYGRRWLRDRRGIVLFLRRFGYDDATKAVTFAAKRIGTTWQLVTLDDAEIAPVGVSTVTRSVFTIGRAVKTFVGRVVMIGARGFPFASGGLFAIIGLEFLRADDWKQVADNGTLDPYEDVVTSVMDGRLPFDAIEPSLVGLFALCAIYVAVSLVVLLVVMVVLIAVLVLMPFFLAIAGSADEVRKAEESKTEHVSSSPALYNVAHDIVEGSKKTFGPTLVVVRVSSEIWQEAVRTFAGVTAVPLIDVSQPTANLAWELEKLIPQFGERCVIVGERDRLVELQAALASPAEGSVFDRVAPLLRGREVLAYTLDRRGMRRFARALRVKLASIG